MTDTGFMIPNGTRDVKVKLSRTDQYLNSLKGVSSRAGRMNIYLFFLLLFTYQILIIFQGLDIVDEGFHATGYQQIFNDPESVQYSFIFWLTDVVGGLVLKFSPIGGLLGLRIAGAIVSLITIIFSYKILRKHISAGTLKLALVLLALSINNDPKDIYYDNLSALLYVITAYLLYGGLTRKNNLLIFAGGLVIGLNIFTRIPNILAPGIGLVIFYYGSCSIQSAKMQVKNFLFFVAGCLTAIAGIFAVMVLLSQFHLYVN